MSSDSAIIVQDLSKCYQIYAAPGDRLKQMIMRGHRQYYREFWALRDVSFSVGKGETVGIVGRNGCGKSTLLQMVCGTLTPTSGTCRTRGRIAALLELGSGFNPEFTGRENVYMNGSVLGLTSDEIDSRFAAVTDFADIGNFIDQPVKSYSSGMMVRLAFAVAINVDPEILVIDEALAVGDELFQRKCFSRIEAIKKSGATILFVSHSAGAVIELCDRAILLDSGEKLGEGNPKKIVGSYQRLLYAPLEKQGEIREFLRSGGELAKNSICSDQLKTDTDEKKSDVNSAAVECMEEAYDPELIPKSTLEYASHGVEITKIALFNMAGERVNHLLRGTVYRYSYHVFFRNPAVNVRFGMMLKTLSGIELGGMVSALKSRNTLVYVDKGSHYQVDFHFQCNLSTGVYFLNAGVTGDVDGTDSYLHRVLDAAMFRVVSDVNSRVTGLIDFKCSCHAENISDDIGRSPKRDDNSV